MIMPMTAHLCHVLTRLGRRKLGRQGWKFKTVECLTGHYISITNPEGQEWGEYTPEGLHLALRGQ